MLNLVKGQVMFTSFQSSLQDCNQFIPPFVHLSMRTELWTIWNGFTSWMASIAFSRFETESESGSVSFRMFWNEKEKTHKCWLINHWISFDLTSAAYLQQKFHTSDSLEGQDQEGLEPLPLTHRVTLELLQHGQKIPVLLPWQWKDMTCEGVGGVRSVMCGVDYRAGTYSSWLMRASWYIMLVT